MANAQIGMIGLAVMGSNLIRNIESHGYRCAVYNRTVEVTNKFMKENEGKNFIACRDLKDFAASLERPRKILIMVKAGAAIDVVVESLLPFLQEGDIVADLGNSFFKDTQGREKTYKANGIRFLGVGVSGGEEGALKGPSIMSGGDPDALKEIGPIFDAIAAKAPDSCHAYCGPDGAGHFVKMVHNGIEYGDMQMIAESYHLLRELINAEPKELQGVFAEWNRGVLSSFLIEITAKIFAKRDPEGSGQIIDKILDKASQKGTGKWTAQIALDLGVPIPTLALAVDARVLSSLKGERVVANQVINSEMDKVVFNRDRAKFFQAVHDALYCSKIISYAQGMSMLQAASAEWSWNLDLGKIAAIWRGGCIIRAQFLNEIVEAYSKNSALKNLVLSPYMMSALKSRLSNWRDVVALAAQNGIPVLAIGSALSYFDSYRTAALPQNLTQAQRDFFGAHTFERTDRDGSYHIEWE